MARKTLKSQGIKRTTLRKHGVLINVYSYKNNFYTTKTAALKASKRSR